MRLEIGDEGPLLRWVVEGVGDIFPWLKEINRKLEDILANQDEIDARAARIETANAAILAEVADLKAQVAAGTPAEELDFSRLDAAVGGEEALEPTPAAVAAEAQAGTTGVVPAE